MSPFAVPPPSGFARHRSRHPVAVAAGSAQRIAVGIVRGIRGWPGLVVVVAAYAATAGGLHNQRYPQLLGALAALVVALLWYGSPLRRWEAQRRARAARQRPDAG